MGKAAVVRGVFARNPEFGGGSWKLANRRPLRHGELSCPCRSGLRFPSTLRRRAVADPPTLRFSRQAPTRWCTTKELAHDALLSQHIDRTARSSSTVVMLTQQPCCSAVVPRHCEVVWHSLRALICRPQLALSQPGSLQVLLVCVVGCMGCAGQVQKKSWVRRKHPLYADSHLWRCAYHRLPHVI